eukprot:27387-Chlamydomonas_euryale.AAC.5
MSMLSRYLRCESPRRVAASCGLVRCWHHRNAERKLIMTYLCNVIFRLAAMEDADMHDQETSGKRPEPEPETEEPAQPAPPVIHTPEAVRHSA